MAEPGMCWTVRDLDGRPISRADYSEMLWGDMAGDAVMLSLITAGEAKVIAYLLDETAGACGEDELGHLARLLSCRIWSRLGI